MQDVNDIPTARLVNPRPAQTRHPVERWLDLASPLDRHAEVMRADPRRAYRAARLARAQQRRSRQRAQAQILATRGLDALADPTVSLRVAGDGTVEHYVGTARALAGAR